MSYNEIFRRRTREPALAIVKWYAGVEYRPEERHLMGKQLIKAATSTGRITHHP